jgi:hypothetical protein
LIKRLREIGSNVARRDDNRLNVIIIVIYTITSDTAAAVPQTHVNQHFVGMVFSSLESIVDYSSLTTSLGLALNLTRLGFLLSK